MRNSFGTYVFSIIILSILFACSSTKYVEKKPPLTVGNLSLSKDIDVRKTLSLPIELTGTFNTQDQKVVALLNLSNLSGNHYIRWDWHNPDGNLYLTTDNFLLEIPEGQYMKEASTWHSLNIHGDKASDYPGQWEVKVYVDDKLIESRPFKLNVITQIDQIPKARYKTYPDDWGIIIGIQEYSNLPDVDYARKDAIVVKEYFNKIIGIPENNIILLIDTYATKSKIESYLKDYLPRNVQKNSTVYVYFAGHGIPDKENGEPYLMPHDGDTRFISRTGYKLQSLYEDLENINVQQSYVFLDACFSGFASRTAEFLAKKVRPALIHVKDVNLQADNIIVFSAAKSDQLSNAHPETEHGLFTYYLLRAIRGEADTNSDNWVSVKEAHDYVRNHVETVSRRIGTEQTPTIMPSMGTIKDSFISRSLR